MLPTYVIYGLSLDGRTHRYVGYTTRGVAWRLQRHREDSRKLGDRVLHRWIRKHGEAAIRATVLEVLPDDATLREREVWWIAELCTYAGDRAGGLNTTRGGDGTYGHRHTPEARARIAAAGTGRRYPERTATAQARRQAAREARCRERGHKREEVETAAAGRRCRHCLTAPAWNAGRSATAAEVERNRAAQLGRYVDDDARAAGRANLALASHVRWHVNRGVHRPEVCEHCRASPVPERAGA